MTPAVPASNGKKADAPHTPTQNLRRPGATPAHAATAPAPTPTDPVGLEQLIDALGREQEARWRRGDRVPLERLLQAHPTLLNQRRAFTLVYAEFLLHERVGERPSLTEFQQRFPTFANELKLQVDAHRIFATLHKTRKLLPGKVPITYPPLESAFPQVPGYQILSELGRSGTSVVYKAQHAAFKRLVALKMVQGDEVSAEARARFVAEAEALARLQHQHIVQIHEIGVYEDRPFFALEYVDGGSLDQKWRGPQEPHAVAELVETLARAVDHAHQADVLHGDLKPSNVLLSAGANGPAAANGAGGGSAWGVPKVSGFGLAKRFGLDDGHRPGKTRSVDGRILGTPQYMAPEQAGNHTAQLGPPLDVYVLGAILYEGLTGRAPFASHNNWETIRQVLEDEPVPPRRLQPKLPRDLDTICLRCLQKDPGKRYPSAEALADDLHRFLASEPIRARPVSLWDCGWEWAKRRPVVAILLATTLILIAVSGSLIALN
jgi:serine/threonine protein kinase